ncbi:MAG: NADH-quinone oxidoreductase subunit J family protein [Thermoprotei archaeon]
MSIFIDVLILATGTIVIVTAILAVEARSLVYSVMSLMVMSLGIAILFMILSASYLTIFQIAVYVGAVVSLILFTVMLFPREPKVFKLSQEGLGILTAMAFLSILLVAILGTTSYLHQTPYINIDIQQWGNRVLKDIIDQYGMSVLVLSLLLSAALIGALAIGKADTVKVKKET